MEFIHIIELLQVELGFTVNGINIKCFFLWLHKLFEWRQKFLHLKQFRKFLSESILFVFDYKLIGHFLMHSGQSPCNWFRSSLKYTVFLLAIYFEVIGMHFQTGDVLCYISSSFMFDCLSKTVTVMKNLFLYVWNMALLPVFKWLMLVSLKITFCL